MDHLLPSAFIRARNNYYEPFAERLEREMDKVGKFSRLFRKTLPTIKETSNAPVEVPYLFDTTYCPYKYLGQGNLDDDSDFISYPQSVRWDKDKLLDGEFEQKKWKATPWKTCASFVQAWLFFGVLSEFLGIPGSVVLEDYVVELDTGTLDARPVVCTRHLGRDLKALGARIKNAPTSEKRKVEQKMSKCISTVTAYIHRVISQSSPFSPAPSQIELGSPNYENPFSFYPEIGLSIMVLTETLSRTMASLFSSEPIYTGTGLNSFLTSRLNAQGLCPSAVSMFNYKLGISTLYCLSLLDPDKDFADVRLDHKHCDAGQCLAYQTDESTYRVRHVEEGCNCSDLVIPVESICRILERNEIPIIKIFFVNGKYAIEIDTSYSADGKSVAYTAISHIWAGGMGNPYRNALPKCQISYIFERIQSIQRPGDLKTSCNVWMDTLCVPQDNGDSGIGIFRSKAIKLMAKTYASAERVLVLDINLMKLSAKLYSREEILLHLVCSPWWRRLWTLQEGMLGLELFFQFKDSSLNPSQIVLGSKEVSTSSFEEMASLLGPGAVVAEDILRFITPLYRSKQLQGRERVSHVLRAVQWRTTSRMSDEIVCLASLFGLELSKVLRDTPAESWEQFLRMVGEFPRAIAFDRSERMQKPGFGWAPTSFIDPLVVKTIVSRSTNVDDDSEFGTICENGLAFRSYGFLLEIPKKGIIDQIFWLLDMEAKQQWVVADARGYGNTQMQDTLSAAIRDFSQIAIVGGKCAVPTELPGTLSTLVGIVKDEDDVYTARHCCTLSLMKQPDDYWEEAESALLKEESKKKIKSRRYIRGIHTPFEQKWCVG
ncbi:het domain protein [Phlyctema vagabunda]|uniref:Het domain protein n=1 Tax=Phlyctema vagabunda TaxID=108571 RepID=A0ABR4P2H0_9HELO